MVEPVVEPVVRPENQGINQGVGTNVGAGGVPDLSTIIAQQLQNLLPTILSQVENQINQPEVLITDNVRSTVGSPAVSNVGGVVPIRNSCHVAQKNMMVKEVQ